MRTWTPHQWVTAAAVALVAGTAIGVPTGVVPTPFYTRMTPVLWWNYPVWVASSLLMGLLVATYMHGPQAARAEGPRGRRALLAGVLSAFAVGCPICNKLVVLALGVSGALSYWAPAQPVLAMASLALLAHALVRRLRTAAACPAPAAPSRQGPAGLQDSAHYDERSLVPEASHSGGEGSERASAG
ncbi:MULTISPECIES: hypothetical protein [Streptomyces violaceusniger group]|uniref:Integral membrane protein n=1 Tax=Streptomyces rhizosphaericus TaxID=114699 RepID=A0ABN1SGC7_9ACTN|nr:MULTISPECIES: hypothetical protein [Streptomyces violaceusniger group]